MPGRSRASAPRSSASRSSGPRSSGRPAARRRGRGVAAVAAAWLPAGFSGRFAQVANLYLLLVLLVVCALGGGSSFADVLSLLYVRPLAVVVLVAGLLVPAPADWRALRVPALLLALFALLMLAQLVPLPPSLWTALPGREPYVPAAALAGVAQPWRPLSLTPDLTWNALVSLVVPAAVLVNYAKLRVDQRRATVVALVVLCCASAALGVAQFAGGGESAFYLYRRTYEGFTVGFLANRNHHAALLALVFPALRVWTLSATADRGWATRRQWLALALGAVTLPVILATGSRAGMALGVLSILATFALFPPRRRQGDAPRRAVAIAWVAAPVLLVLLGVLTWLSGRAASVDRLVALSDVDADFRFRFAPVMGRIVAETFPAGTGLGSFDPVFRQYEPDAILKATYFNHAHNELFEMAITAGLPGLLLVAGLVGWWGWRMLGAGRAPGSAGRTVRLGGVAVAVLLLASLVDYPLRAPLMALVFALACCWLCDRSDRSERAGVATPGELG